MSAKQNTVSDLVVKTVFTEDVRRFKLPRASLVLLRDLISKTYEKLPSGFLIKYTDPEGDACSIGSDAELEEAFNISGSTLKLDIFAVDDGRAPRIELPKSSPPPEDSEPESFEVVNETSEPTSEPAFPEPQPAEGKEKDEGKGKDEGKEKDEGKDEGKDQDEEGDTCALVLELAQDPEVQVKFPEIFKSITASIEKGAADLKSIILDLFAAVPLLKEHPTIKKILPTLTKNAEKINASLERLKNFLPMILPFLKDLPMILPQLLASVDLEHLREHLKGVFEGQGFPYDVCGEEEDTEGTSDEKEAQQQPTHANIKCDGCGVLPISGDRYKCTICHDFDLCASCEKKDIHPSSHPLLKLKEPARRDIHHGVTCDGCGKKPIEGVRYKCLACPNFDLCSRCEEKNQHPSDHTLLKLKEHNPRKQHGFGPRGGPFSFGHHPRGPFGPFGPFSFGPHHGPHHHGPHHGPHGPHGPHHGPRGHGFFGLLKSLGIFGGPHGNWNGRHAEKCARRAEKCLKKEEASQAKLARCAEKCARKAEAVQEKCARKAEKCARRVEKWARSGSKCHRRKHHQTAEFAAEFVQDINIRDGATLAPGGAVVKQWRLKNTGSAKWPEGSKVIFLRGARELLGEQEEFAVPLAEPGHTVDIAVPLLIPEKAGSYSAKFQLADKDRAVFGHRFWVEFIVKEEEKLLSSAPSSTSATAPTVKETKESAKEVDVKETKKVVQGLTSTIPLPSTSTTAVPSSVPVSTSKYASLLGVLEKMGFVNEKLNSSLLDRSQGNIEQVVTWLLEMENSMPRV